MNKVWLVTGVSTGIGRELAIAALAQGDTVVGTLRKAEQLAEFEALVPGRAIGFLLDVTDRARIAEEIPALIERLGHLDVLVNNAGYGINGALEELTDEDIDRCMATNYGGTVAMIRAVLPHMRGRRKGDIVNMSSIAGLVGYPGLSAYCAPKFAVAGLSEALSGELAPLGIRVMVVEPGPFRTEFSLGSLVRASKTIEDYEDTPAGRSRRMMGSNGGTEVGDPVRLARIIVDMLDRDTLPVHFVAGAPAIASHRAALDQRSNELDRWAELGAQADFSS
jgi:NAD(P)-dependent dehydrogenase (short-subunit alcohol dehydrogenase family)